MFQAFVILLREGFEAALIVAIVFAYLRKIGRQDLAPPVWSGVIAALATATGIGLVVRWTIGGLEGEAELMAYAAISATAAVVLTWMIFWMRRQSRMIAGDLHRQIEEAVASRNAARGAMLVAFVAVLREGIEAALFLIAAAVSVDGATVFVGGFASLVAAGVLGFFVYAGGRKIAMRTFFRVTGILLIVFAGGLLAKAVFFLQAAGHLGTVNNALYDVTGLHWLTVDTESGRILAGLCGWDPRPSLEQVVVWVAYLVPVMTWFLAGERAPRPARVAVEATSS